MAVSISFLHVGRLDSQSGLIGEIQVNTREKKRGHTVRNLIIFVLAFNALGWLGWMVAQDGTQEAIGLGNLIWLIAPLVVSILIRLFSKDWRDIGIKPNFRGNGRWYAFSVFVFPGIVLVIVLVGLVFGRISPAGLGVTPFVQSVIASFFSFTLVKNLFEEFAWRGYLTPKVNSLVKNPLVGHLIVGLIWACWHIPYYLALIDQASFAAYTSQKLSVFLPLVVLGTTIAGILFGEIRLITGSTWPAYLMHMMSNAVIMTLLIDGFVQIDSRSAFLFTPSWEGLFSMILTAAAGLWLFRQRAKGSTVVSSRPEEATSHSNLSH